MPSNKQRDLSPVLAKKERKKFAIFISFIILLSANLSTLHSASYTFNEQRDLSILRVDVLHLILGIGVSLSILLSIFSIYKKSYRMIVSIGCIFLIIANLGFIFGENYLGLDDLLIIELCPALLLFPAIFERIRQLGPAKKTLRLLDFTLASIPLSFFAFQKLLSNFDNDSTLNSMLFFKLLCAGFSLCILFLWMSSMKKNIWVIPSTEEESSGKSSSSRIDTVKRILSNMIMLRSLGYMAGFIYTWIYFFNLPV